MLRPVVVWAWEKPKKWIKILAGLEHDEAIPNKIKWDIDELVLKVNDLLSRLISFQRWL